MINILNTSLFTQFSVILLDTLIILIVLPLIYSLLKRIRENEKDIIKLSESIRWIYKK